MNGARIELIIIGNGMATGAVLEELVKLSPPPAITVFGGEPHVAYNRILLSDVLACAKTMDDISLKAPAWYEDHGIKLHTGTLVTSIDTSGKKITTSSGASYSYDKLIIATGSVPLIPAIHGTDKNGVFTFRN